MCQVHEHANTPTMTTKQWKEKTLDTPPLRVVAVIHVSEREHTSENSTTVRGRKRRRDSVQICCISLDSVQAIDWRLERAWIDPKLGALVSYFEYLIWLAGLRIGSVEHQI